MNSVGIVMLRLVVVYSNVVVMLGVIELMLIVLVIVVIMNISMMLIMVLNRFMYGVFLMVVDS